MQTHVCFPVDHHFVENGLVSIALWMGGWGGIAASLSVGSDQIKVHAILGLLTLFQHQVTPRRERVSGNFLSGICAG